MRLRSQIAALCLAALATPLSARPFTVDDLLAAEEFGQIGFSPEGDHLVFERLLGQAVSGPFDQDVATGYRRSRLYVVDLKRGGPAMPLLPSVAGEGQIAGPFSPDGRHLVVMRFLGDAYEAGIVTLETGAVRWLGVTPELGWLGQTVVWRNDHEVLFAARPAGEAPMRLRTGPSRRRDLQALWAETAAGAGPAVRVVGSGSHLLQSPPGPPGALILADLRNGEQRRLAEGDFYDLELSPDGQQVAAMQRLEPIQAPADWPLQVAGDFQRRNLTIADLARGTLTTPCPGCHLATHLIAWSTTGREVLVYGHADGPYRGPSGYIRLSPGAPARRIETPGLKPAIDRTSEGYEIPRAAWLGSDPLVLARPEQGGRADWWRVTPDGPVNLTQALPPEPGALAGLHGDGLVLRAGGAAWRVDASGKTKRLFTASGEISRAELGLSSRTRMAPSSRPVWFWVPAARMGPDRLISSARGQVLFRAAQGRGLALVAGPRAAAQVRRDAAGPMTLDLLQPDGARRKIMTLNEGLLAVDFAPTRLLPVKAGDLGKHVLLLPPNLSPGERPPLVVIPYPGLTYTTAPEPYGRGTGRFSANAEVLAAAGFAVLLPSLPRLEAEPGAGLADQIMAAVDQAAATGLVDAERLGLLGHSFGGYGSLMAAAQSPRFKSVIASAAPTDLTAVYGAFDPHAETRAEDGLNLNANYGWLELGQAGLGTPPWADPDRYRRNSPVQQVDHISAPVMLIHGDDDFIRLSQAQQMFSALYRQGKDAELVTYFGEGHIVSSPKNLADMYRRMVRWLQASLDRP